MGQEKRSWLERFEAAYPLLIAGMVSAGNVAMTLIQTVIISFGLLFILVALMVVEQHGIKDGLLWFMTDLAAAEFAAGAAVVLNLMIDMHIVHMEREGKYKNPIGQAWSARLWARELRYRVGFGKDWKPKRTSPAQRFISLRLFITVTIFVLALSGRMRVAIDSVSQTGTGAALDAGTGVHKLLFESSLADIFRWTGGTLFTMLAVVSVQSLTHYMALTVVEIQEDLRRRAKNAKAATTRLMNREAKAVSRIASTSVDIYELERLRDNTLQPIKIGKGDHAKYRCPKCDKEMTRSGWSRHSCRHTQQVTGLTQQAVNRLTTDTQPVSTDPQPEQQDSNVAGVE